MNDLLSCPQLNWDLSLTIKNDQGSSIIVNSLIILFVAMSSLLRFSIKKNFMSASAVQEFFAKVSEDPALQVDLTKVMQAENYCQIVTEIASAKGYVFSVDELLQVIDAWYIEMQKTGELDEEELEAVSGGFAGNRPLVCGSVRIPPTIKFPILRPLSKR